MSPYSGEYLIQPAREKNFDTWAMVLPAGKRRIVSIHPGHLARNRTEGCCLPAVCVRDDGDADDAVICRDIEILGPSAIYHTPDRPLPSTDGRGVCYLVTEAALRLHIDKEKP